MAKFGLFRGSSQVPSQQYEGDYMTQDGEFVKIFKKSDNPSDDDRQVAALRLEQNQSVREL
jgi:hypothetical protein